MNQQFLMLSKETQNTVWTEKENKYCEEGEGEEKDSDSEYIKVLDRNNLVAKRSLGKDSQSEQEVINTATRLVLGKQAGEKDAM